MFLFSRFRRKYVLHFEETLQVVTLTDTNIGYRDGISSQARFSHPYGVAIDINDNIFVCDEGNHKIRLMIRANGQYTCKTLCGTVAGFHDGDALEAKFYCPHGIALHPDGSLYIADGHNHLIRKLSSDFKTVTTAVGVRGSEEVKGNPINIALKFPYAVNISSSGHLYIADTCHHRILKIDLVSNTVLCVAGSSLSGHEDGLAKTAKFHYPSGLALDSSGAVYVSDSFSNRIRKVDAEFKNVTTVVGRAASYRENNKPDNPALCFQLKTPEGIVLDPTETFLFISDRMNHRIVAWNLKSNVVEAIKCESKEKDVPPPFRKPGHISLDSYGNIVVVDSSNNCIRKILAGAMPWKFARLLWIGHLKNTAQDCHLARLPKEMIDEIIQAYS